ncbi:hypothetical protein QQZ08_012087 [Neonectria magnoliae]|uniref:HMG box domain-containing protein n=1 Tax=Neonectria magnoliae TaxID=2732573 RepID=A0ABR1H5L2_9HYPO
MAASQQDLPPRIPFVFVTSPEHGECHVFVPETFDVRYVYGVVAFNFSKLIGQPVKVYHDANRKKYRLAPLGFDVLVDAQYLGRYCFTLDHAAMMRAAEQEPKAGDIGPDATITGRIPRPPNSWILYRTSKSQEVANQNPGITAAQISTVVSSMWKNEAPEVKAYWQGLAEEEERKHKAQHPGYKSNAGGSKSSA